MGVVAWAPNHLGDGVMALPALQGLAAVDRLTIVATRPWARDLFRGIDAMVVKKPPRTGDTAVLFPPSIRVAWEARRFRRRIGVAADGRRLLLSHAVPECGHRREVYASLARTAGATVRGDPVFRPKLDDPTVDVPQGHLALVPLSVSGAVREWPRYRQLAKRSCRPVVFYGGPGEEERLARVAVR